MNSVGFSFNLEKIQNEGEDADPVLLVPQPNVLGACWVFDGLGGAGSQKYMVNGQPVKGAWIASRLARKIVAEYFDVLAAKTCDTLKDLDLNELERRLQDAFQKEQQTLLRTDLNRNRSTIKSSLLKLLPTTVAGLCLIPTKEATLHAEAVWSGDSRCYSMDIHKGLRHLTRGDSVGDGDALQQLQNDPGMSSCVSASNPVKLTRMVYCIPLPSVVLAATDGCFGYLPSPVHFEKLLLQTLLAAGDMEAWKQQLQMRLKIISGDDASMAILATGWETFEELKAAFKDRAFKVKTETIALDSIEKKLRMLKELPSSATAALERERNAIREKLWQTFKSDYEDVSDIFPRDCVENKSQIATKSDPTGPSNILTIIKEHLWP